MPVLATNRTCAIDHIAVGVGPEWQRTTMQNDALSLSASK